MRRNATNSSRGSNLSQASSIARHKAFTQVGKHRATVNRPKIPAHPKVVELTTANLRRKQVADAAAANVNNYFDDNKSLGSKKSGTNQTTFSGQVKVEGPKSDFPGGKRQFDGDYPLLNENIGAQTFINGKIDASTRPLEPEINAYGVGDETCGVLSPETITTASAGGGPQKRS